MKTYHVITYGCQMNRSDSERVEAVLSSAGLSYAEKPEDADVIVVNACSVRQSAIDRIWGNLEHFNKWKKERPFLTILTGCVLPSDKPKFQTRFDAVIPIKEIETLPKILSSLGTASLVIPNLIGNPKTKNRQIVISSVTEGEVGKSHSDSPNKYDEISPLGLHLGRDDDKNSFSFGFLDSRLRENDNKNKPYNYFTNQPLTPLSQNTVSNTYLNLRPKHVSKFSAFVPIMTGCNAFCTYCAVPYTRGAEENRKPQEVIQEVEDLVMNKNYNEVTLLGQIVNKYNVRATDELLNFLQQYQTKYAISLSFLDDPVFSQKRIYKFHHLLETLGKLPKKYWLRFTSSHPNWFTDELISTIRDIPNIPKHFHLPVQAGSDSVLLRMRRPYNIAHYLEFVKKIREQIPLAAITTDCIVGFCGETEEEFQETLHIFEEVRYDMAFTAQYSPRPDTFAFKNLINNVPHEVKEEREKRLTEVLKQTALENNQRLIGMTIDVLIYEKKEDGLYFGISENSKHVHVETDSPRLRFSLPRGKAGKAGRDLPIGNFIPMTITSANPWSLKGKAIS